MASLATLAAARWAAEAAPTASPEAVPPKIKEIHVQKVGALTGPEAPFATKPLDICGTDLGTMTEIGNLIFFAFGDTFGYDGDSCRGAGGPNWRSNAFERSEGSNRDHPCPGGRGLNPLESGYSTLDVHVFKRADSLYRTTRGRLPLGAVERPAYGR